MARSLRVEYPGARYHLMCRGNQSRNIFLAQPDADLFIRTLGEMCVRNEVRIHAWCLMSNHYHLLAETPAGNLVDAMKWFQGTFTQRYNARHKLWGHLFQGRYKAKVVDDGNPDYYRAVGDYIHLNPSATGLVRQGGLAAWPWSSYPLYLTGPSTRPDWLVVDDMLSACGIPKDSPVGRQAYASRMELRHQEVVAFKKGDPAAREWAQMERGWVHGGETFRQRMIECLAEDDATSLCRVGDREQKRDLGEAAAKAVMDRCLGHFGIAREELPRLPKSDPRKMLVAGLLRYRFPVTAAWLGEVLCMGHYTTISRAMRFFDDPGAEWIADKEQILKFTG